MSWGFWLPGEFRLANQALSDMRAAGFANGSRYSPIRDRYSEQVAQVRASVVTMVRFAKVPTVPPDYCALVSMDVFGHGKADPDAACLLGKAVVDGLVEAKVIASDRRQIWSVPISRVLQSSYEEELCAAIARRHGIELLEGARKGAVVAIAAQHRDAFLDRLVQGARCGHA